MVSQKHTFYNFNVIIMSYQSTMLQPTPMVLGVEATTLSVAMVDRKNDFTSGIRSSCPKTVLE